MATFVLVHGAFIGGWAFRRVLPLLRQAGHEAHAPTLTGSGERAHLHTSDVGLATHILDVVNLIKYEDLHDVVLVGHSYAGIVVTNVADRLRDRVSQIVYLDSQIATHGQNALGQSPGNTAEKLGSMTENAPAQMLPPISLDAMGIFDAADRAWVEPKLMPLPMKCLLDVSHLEHGDPKMPRHYVVCSQRESMVAFFQGDPLAGFVEKARNEGFQFHEIASGHHPMITHPKQLAALLESIASSRAD